MRNLLWTLMSIFALAEIGSAQYTYYLPQVADGIQSGGIGWVENIAVTNTATGTAAASGTITFTQDDGTPFNISLTDELNNPVGSGNSVPFQIAGGQTRFFASTAAGPLKTGYATITSNLPVSVGGVFVEYGNNGLALISEAGVPSTQPLTRQTIITIKTKHTSTGIAVANAGNSAANITFQLLDTNGVAALPAVIKPLPAKQHTAFFVDQLFPNIPAKFYGTLSITSDVPLEATALVFQDTGQFATLPVFALQ